ncbi:Lateral flagellin [Massilia sp. Dwa41.01b]|uniref:flagellin N-terminal helical domain-containing protein n=1 Tax=unclassified Massilia TaxID=2609279 RepID=UPI00160391F5|nr:MULTISPECIES: flagellin [unclassified Massilia]QNA88224.1 Lateral flagellin [Massilia sp. Dwa41.01b]QNA99124.1 Lateral flagellin [Massilia sp. Se16.2.3]
MLSLHTNAASLSAQNSLSTTQSKLSTSMTRLSTGYRINSAMDDAAGLQIATRLKSQTSGMAVAMRNTQNSISMLQTAEGALDETGNILLRMKDLATQAADGSSSKDDQTAMQSEFDSLADELSNIMKNTKFGGTTLLNKDTGKLKASVTFQIGADKAETMSGNFTTELTDVHAKLLLGSSRFAGGTAAGASATGTEISGTDAAAGATAANLTIQDLSDSIDSVSALRSKIGAVSNRLDHVYNNLSNISTNTQNAAGRIMDVDFATESAKMTSNQMLMQAGTAMLKQTNQMSSMVMSLLQ